MKNSLFIIFILLFFTIPAQAEPRIVSLAPNLTEIVFSIGAGALLVGTVNQSNHPAAALKIPRVGQYTQPDTERILALNPDLVLFTRGNPLGLIDQLKALNIPVYISDPKYLEDIPKEMKRLGRLVGKEREAREAGFIFLKKLSAFRAKYAGRRKVSVFYAVWSHPLMTINGETMIDEVIRQCGGKNIVEGLPIRYATIDVESILCKDPAIIFVNDRWEIKRWQRFEKLQAVRRRAIYFIDPDSLERNSPYILEGMETVCRLIDEVRKKELKKLDVR